MKLFRIRSYSEYVIHTQKMAEEYLHYQTVENQILPKKKKKIFFHGFSYPAGRCVKFYIDYRCPDGSSINWRETIICPLTKLNNRLRGSLHLFDIELMAYPSNIIYITEQVTPLYSFLSERYRNIIGSEYLGAKVNLGDMNEKGIRNEDLTHLSLDDETVDHVLSFDCFEHFPDHQRAFKECHRILKPRGKMLWSVPFNRNSEQNIIRAQRKSDGSIKHLLEPEYHGDPVTSKGCLCFAHFGWEMLRQIRESGFSDAYAVLFWAMDFGYLGSEQILFVAYK